MAKEYYDNAINGSTDWGGDASTGGKQVKGGRVQEYIKSKFGEIASNIHNVKVQSPSVFGGFVDNVTVSKKDVGSDYQSIVYDTSKHLFLAVVTENDSTTYHRVFADYDLYNVGTYPNAYPHDGKIYVFQSEAFVGTSSGLSPFNAIASEEEVRSIVTSYEDEASEEQEEEEE